MVHQFTRKEINARLRQKIADKKPIVIGGAGIGLVAKLQIRQGSICSWVTTPAPSVWTVMAPFRGIWLTVIPMV